MAVKGKKTATGKGSPRPHLSCSPRLPYLAPGSPGSRELRAASLTRQNGTGNVESTSPEFCRRPLPFFRSSQSLNPQPASNPHRITPSFSPPPKSLPCTSLPCSCVSRASCSSVFLFPCAMSLFRKPPGLPWLWPCFSASSISSCRCRFVSSSASSAE